MLARDFAKKAHEQAAYSAAQIAEICDVSKSTVRSWKSKDKWHEPPKRVSKAAHAEIEQDALTVDTKKGSGAEVGNKKAVSHGLRTRAYKFFNAEARAIIADALSNPDVDELELLRESAAVSLGLISTWGNQITELEQKIHAVGGTAADGEAGGIISSVILIDEHSHGTRAGKNENLTTSKIEKKVVRFYDAISILQDKISRENGAYSRTIEKLANTKINRSRLLPETSENENATGLVAAMDRIADRLGSNADIED